MADFYLTRRHALTTVAAATAAWALPGRAQTAGGSLAVGIVRPYTGPLKGVAAGYVEALKALFDSVNAQGGINGSKLELVEKDDEGVPANTEKQVRALGDDPRLLAVLGIAGTGNILAAYPVLEATRLPLIGPFSGSPALREAKYRQIFHVRASYEGELEEIANNISDRAPKGKVVVLYQDDTFGAGSFAVLTARMSIKAPGVVLSGYKFDRNTGAFLDAATAQAALHQADAVVFVGAPKSVGMLLKSVRADNSRATAYTLSVVDALGLVKDVGAPVAHGLLITQVMPNPRKSSFKLVRDYRALMEATKQSMSYAGLEGYLTGRVLLDVLGRIKTAPTRDKVYAMLEDGSRMDLGGLTVSFSRKSHEGAKFVDLSMVSSTGSIID